MAKVVKMGPAYFFRSFFGIEAPWSVRFKLGFDVEVSMSPWAKLLAIVYSLVQVSWICPC